MLIADLPPNARHSILWEPLWAVPGTISIYYATLYQKTAGLSTLEIGLIASLGLYLACCAQLLAGTITDRLGRKQTTLIFDLLSWSVPMFIWAFADSFWLFLLAALCSSLSRVVNLSFFLLVTEDATERQRPRIFAAIKLVVMAAGLLTPLAGIAMARYGTLPTLRWVYLLGGVSMTALFLIRNHLTTETAAGHQSAAAPRGPLLGGVARGLRMLGLACRSRQLWPVVALCLLTNLAVQINLFQVVHLADNLHYGTTAIAALPAVAAVTAFACYLGPMPRWQHRPLARSILTGLLLSTAGWLAFLTVPRGGLTVLLLSTVLTAAGPFLLESYRDALVVSAIPALDRAELSSAIQTATALVAIPSGYLAAVLYDHEPQLLFGAVAGCYGLSALAVLPLLKDQPAIATDQAASAASMTPSAP
ncbi:MFS family permease [Kitasatospora gansuensis]|uniref:MFS family permease n=1 Tax=Kitasatospora gansuensis TaxID=258050 RepID=A0A7W7S9Q9_9ACTN|nr:MFS transporter [Kitasatospora gansuensis]MBB4946292.1 MFS family permease [Kitasatospora gansuensis]